MSLGFGIPVGIALGINSEFALRLMPAMINLSMLILFSSTLFSVPMIERFARMYAPKLSDAQKKHCLQFTKIWMIFFGINATIAFILCWAPRTWWTLYTGLVNYLVMGILFASEFIMRRFRFHEFTEHFYDRFLKHLFSLSTNRDLT